MDLDQEAASKVFELETIEVFESQDNEEPFNSHSSINETESQMCSDDTSSQQSSRYFVVVHDTQDEQNETINESTTPAESSEPAKDCEKVIIKQEPYSGGYSDPRNCFLRKIMVEGGYEGIKHVYGQTSSIETTVLRPEDCHLITIDVETYDHQTADVWQKRFNAVNDYSNVRVGTLGVPLNDVAKDVVPQPVKLVSQVRMPRINPDGTRRRWTIADLDNNDEPVRPKNDRPNSFKNIFAPTSFSTPKKDSPLNSRTRKNAAPQETFGGKSSDYLSKVKLANGQGARARNRGINHPYSSQSQYPPFRPQETLVENTQLNRDVQAALQGVHKNFEMRSTNSHIANPKITSMKSYNFMDSDSE